MSAGTDDDDLSKGPQPRQQTIWPEDQRMEVQQNAANRMFRRNSEELQRGQAAGRTEQAQNAAMADPVTKEQARGNYSQLKQAHAAETTRTDQGRGRQDQGTEKTGPIRDGSSAELTFAKSTERSTERSPKQSPPNDSGRQQETLTFAKHRSQHDRSKLKQEHANEVSREAKAPQRDGEQPALQFAKNRGRGGHDLSRG